MVRGMGTFRVRPILKLLENAKDTRGSFGEPLKHVITYCGQILVSRKLPIRDEPNIRLRCKTNVKKTCFTDENTPLPVCPLKHVPICTLKTSQCVPAPRAHVSTRVRVVPAFTGTFLNVHTEAFFF